MGRRIDEFSTFNLYEDIPICDGEDNVTFHFKSIFLASIKYIKKYLVQIHSTIEPNLQRISNYDSDRGVTHF